MNTKKIARLGLELLDEAVLEIFIEEKRSRRNALLTKRSIREKLGMDDTYVSRTLIDIVIRRLDSKYSLECDKDFYPPLGHYKWRLLDEEYQNLIG